MAPGGALDRINVDVAASGQAVGIPPGGGTAESPHVTLRRGAGGAAIGTALAPGAGTAAGAKLGAARPVREMGRQGRPAARRCRVERAGDAMAIWGFVFPRTTHGQWQPDAFSLTTSPFTSPVVKLLVVADVNGDGVPDVVGRTAAPPGQASPLRIALGKAGGGFTTDALLAAGVPSFHRGPAHRGGRLHG